MSLSMRDAWGLRYSAQGLSRGNRSRSMMTTFAPALASANAVAAPAGPPPATMTSASLTPGRALVARCAHVRAQAVETFPCIASAAPVVGGAMRGG